MKTEYASQQTISVVEDRGLVASSLSRGVVFPVSANVTQRLVIRQTGGERSPDGSYPISLEYLDQDSTVRDALGTEQRMPNATRLRGLVVDAVVEPSGNVRQDSVRLRGGSAEDMSLLKPVLLAVFDQLKGLAPVRLQQGVPISQETRLSLPIANLASIDLATTTFYTLRRISDGIAEIDTKISMSFGQPKGPLKIVSNGFGSGSMRYAVDNKRVDHFETRSVMSFDIESTEGTLRIQSTSLNTMSMSDGPSVR
ncbi:hypothetical protein HZ992_15045 [Rhizobacter sp. AJA081-3]|uniref:hypothetical protein n=1 Tax=Rhizobacter sp. AJA081-3 TaxID=2753607 RepID=UPI001ADF49DC|nr:hypothetical protein [Rhizobacter sp. AJA081-3]QTN21501.1 hypothetical protein HZ992_15045 [Rhizobacter sp. AJA081-3]